MKLDTICLVETPEGIDLHAEVVGLVPRALAYSIDLLIRFIAIFIGSMVIAFFGMGEAGYGFLLIGYFLLEWWYPVVFEVYRGGQTIGKKSFNIKVVNDDLTPVRLGPSLTRNLLRTADFFPAFYVFGVISIVLTKRFQRLGDLAANTIVIYQQNDTYDLSALQHVKAVVPTMTLNEVQQTAFVNFALNRGGLSKARQTEIAQIIRPLLPMNVDDPAEYASGVGKWLLGSK